MTHNRYSGWLIGFCVILLVLAVLPTQASAQSILTDRIWGDDVDEIFWTEGTWFDSGNPGDECYTFAGGVTTPADGTFLEDVQACAFVPNTWTWEVTIPGPQTITWTVQNFPVGIQLCAQLFYPEGFVDIMVQFDVANNWLFVVDSEGNILYNGDYDSFVPLDSNLIDTELTRCAQIDLGTPTIETTWGRVKSLY